jgi:hypothetical protein
MQKLVTNFTTSCWIPSCKALITFMKTLDKKIPNFQLFLNAKKYNSTNKTNLTDKERYDALIGEINTLVGSEESLKIYCNNFNYWTQELCRCLSSETVYESLSVNFLKGSYAKMVDDFNRILLPKNTDDDDEETKEPTENMKKYVKNYSQDFNKVLEEYVSNGYKLYKSILNNQEDDDTPVKEEMLKIDSQVFSIYAFRADYYEDFNRTQTKLLCLWVSEKPLDYEEITIEQYIELIENIPFNLNPEHLTNMDTIKRNYINKQFDLLKQHVKLLINSNSLFFYKAKYLHSSDYDSYNELQFSNAVNSFPTGYEDYTRNAFALFYFDKKDTVNIETFWITSKPVEQVLSDYDRGLFDWTESNCDDFILSSELYSDSSLSMLH